MSVETLMPFEILPNESLKRPLRIVLLVNEMCASMCDIFSAMLQDNGLATLVGSRTMGAGGNVVTHFQAPNSHLIVRQTESLILRRLGGNEQESQEWDAAYIENHGVQPEIEIDMSSLSGEKYQTAQELAYYLLTQSNRKRIQKRIRKGTQLSYKRGRSEIGLSTKFPAWDELELDSEVES
jgi:C-terminal processing protease CtpA/Prc